MRERQFVIILVLATTIGVYFGARDGRAEKFTYEIKISDGSNEKSMSVTIDDAGIDTWKVDNDVGVDDCVVMNTGPVKVTDKGLTLSDLEYGPVIELVGAKMTKEDKTGDAKLPGADKCVENQRWHRTK